MIQIISKLGLMFISCFNFSGNIILHAIYLCFMQISRDFCKSRYFCSSAHIADFFTAYLSRHPTGIPPTAQMAKSDLLPEVKRRMIHLQATEDEERETVLLNTGQQMPFRTTVKKVQHASPIPDDDIRNECIPIHDRSDCQTLPQIVPKLYPEPSAPSLDEEYYGSPARGVVRLRSYKTEERKMEVKTFSTLPRTPAPASRPERPPPPRIVSPRALLPLTLSNRRPPSAALRAPPREEEEEEGELPDIPFMDAYSDEEDDDGHSSEELEEFEYVDPCKPGACKARKRWKRKRRQRKERRWYNYK
ncbi:uncharacterized protein LOC144618760 [Crassostrea virginica]